MSRMAPVELVEGDEPHDDAPTTRGALTNTDAPTSHDHSAGDHSAGKRSAPRRQRRARVLVAAAAALVVAGVAVTQAVLDARQRAHESRFDHVAGVLAALGGPPEASGLVLARPGGLTAAGGVLVEPRADRDASGLTATLTLTGYDRGTLEHEWSRTLPVPPAVLAHDDAVSDASPSVRCATLGAQAERLACVVEGGVRSVRENSQLLVVVDGASGAVLDQRAITVEAWGVVDDLVVTATVERSRGDLHEVWTVSAWGADGSLAWRVQPRRAAIDRDEPAGGAWTQASPGRVMLNVVGRWWLLDGQGRTLADGDRPRGDSEGDLLVRGSVVGISQSDAGTRLTFAGARRALPEDPLWLTVDDGSAAGVVFSRATTSADGMGELTARRGDTGSLLWRVESSAYQGVLLDDTLYLCDSRLEALDARTGVLKWRAPQGALSCSVATDGRVVISIDDSGHLRAFGIDDGAPVWESTPPAPQGAAFLSADWGVLHWTITDEGRMDQGDRALLLRSASGNTATERSAGPG